MTFRERKRSQPTFFSPMWDGEHSTLRCQSHMLTWKQWWNSNISRKWVMDKSRSPRPAGGILAQGRSLVNRASSLSSSRCQGLHCPGEPAAIWPNLRAWSTGPPHLPLQSASSPRWQSFEEVRFFRVSFHSFRQKRDSPSEWLYLLRCKPKSECFF